MHNDFSFSGKELVQPLRILIYELNIVLQVYVRAFCACFTLYVGLLPVLVELSTSGTMQQLYTDSECSEDAGDSTAKRGTGELRLPDRS